MMKRLNDICNVKYAQVGNGGGVGNYKSTGKHINVICKDLSNKVIYVERLTYDKSSMSTLYDVVEKVKRNKEVKKCHFIAGYTYNIREQILYSDYLKNGKIDWNRNLTTLI